MEKSKDENGQIQTIHSIFAEIGLYLFGDFENVDTHEPLKCRDKFFIREKSKDTSIAYDVSSVMDAYRLKKITDFIEHLKKGENK